MADWLWNPRPLYTHINVYTHYVGPKAMVDLEWTEAKTGRKLFSDAISVCGIWGNEGSLPDPPQDCSQCIKVINNARSGAAITLGSQLAQVFKKPTPLQVRDALQDLVPQQHISQVLNMDYGDRVLEAISYEIEPHIAAKRIINDIHRYNTFWPLAIRLMWLESHGTEYSVLRPKYLGPSDKLIVVEESVHPNHAYL